MSQRSSTTVVGMPLAFPLDPACSIAAVRMDLLAMAHTVKVGRLYQTAHFIFL